MTKNKIYFITDAGKIKKLGYGHFVRCLYLAKFYKDNYEIFFIQKKKNLNKIILKNKFKLVKNNQIKNKNSNAIAFIDLPKINKVDKTLLKKFNKIIIIDEFNNCLIKKKRNIKIIKSDNINQIMPLKLYKFLFISKNNLLNIENKKINILVSFGGSDYLNLGKKIKKKITSEKLNKKYNFLFAKGFLKNKKSKNFFIKDLNKILANYKIDIFIGSGGNTMFEIFQKKIPSLIFPTTKAELRYFNFLKKVSSIKKLKLNYCLEKQILLILKNKTKNYYLLKKNSIIKYYNNLIRF
jgi:spore coat polysaccharide biosynthesis predicted glycosyltransferase SpsG